MRLNSEQENLFFQAFSFETRQLGSAEAKLEVALRLVVLDEPARNVRVRQMVERYLTEHDEALAKLDGNFASQKEAAGKQRERLSDLLAVVAGLPA
jgi:hypothetical protein